MRFRHLALASVVVSVSCLPPVAYGTDITATITGTVASGNDSTGVFGPSGSQLAGDAFTLTFTFDDSLGVQKTVLNDGVPDSSEISNTSTSNPGTATLEIDGHSFTFGVLNAARSADSEFARHVPPDGSEVVLAAGDGFLGDGSSIAGTVDPATGTILTTDYNWEDSFSDSDLENSASFGFEISEFGTTGQGVSSGALIPKTLMVIGLSPATVPEPAAYGLLGIGFITLALMTRRRRLRSVA